MPKRTRDKPAALKFLKKLLMRYRRASAITTDGQCSYKAAMMDLCNSARLEVGRWANNRVEYSHRPFRRRERAMQRFRKTKTLQKFSAVHAAFHNRFDRDRRRADAGHYGKIVLLLDALERGQIA